MTNFVWKHQTSNENIVTRFSFKQVQVSEVLRNLKNLKRKKSVGLDDLPPGLFKDTANVIAEPLTYIINLSLNTGIIPTDWKKGKIIPIYKSGSAKDIDNYRPITILPVASKILEKCVHSQVLNYLEENKLLSDSQFGYRPHRSTELAATLFLDNIRENMDKGQLTGAIFIDLRKAFDTISHSLIVSKLPNYGISGIEKEWFTNYLFAREQCVSVNGEQSSFKPVKCGVPQGSILGPLLFIMHFNGIVASLNNCKILMYADDTVIYYSHKDIEVIEKKLQDDLASITSWLQQNQLIINMKKGKTESMLFGTGKRLSTLNDRQMNLECNGSKVNFTSHYKYLGAHLRPSLNMNDHVNKAFKKASGYLKLLAKTRFFLSTKASLDIYRAMVIPVLTYCSLVCTCSTTTQKKRLESFEKRAARIIFGTSEEQASNRMPSVETIQKKKSCILTFRCLNNNVCQNFLNYFTLIDSKVATIEIWVLE